MRGRRHIGEFLGGFQTWKMTTTISCGGGALDLREAALVVGATLLLDRVEALADAAIRMSRRLDRGLSGARDDDLEDLLAAGIDVRPPWLGPGHGPGLGPNEGLLPGENPEGVLGPDRPGCARTVAHEREAAGRAARAGRVDVVDHLADENSPAAGHAAGPAGGRRRIRDGEERERERRDLTSKSPAADAGDGGDRTPKREETSGPSSGGSAAIFGSDRGQRDGGPGGSHVTLTCRSGIGRRRRRNIGARRLDENPSRG